MSPVTRKRKAFSRHRSAPKWLSFLKGPGRPVVLAGLLAGASLGAWYLAWANVRQQVLVSGEYIVELQQVEVTPLPAWIHSDIRAEVFRNTSLDGPLSIMDDDLTERIRDAFSLHPWIAAVRRVAKHHPARVTVEVTYRRPVCMVAVPGGRYPVDAQGVRLPAGDFSPNEAAGYPLLVGIDTVPVGTVGEGWGDVRVLGGAAIAAALRDVWDELNLSQIVPSEPAPRHSDKEHTYALLTCGGTRVLWGRAPDTRVHDEPSVAEKISRLKQLVAIHGSLDGRRAPEEFDIRKLRPPRVSSLLRRRRLPAETATETALKFGPSPLAAAGPSTLPER